MKTPEQIEIAAKEYHKLFRKQKKNVTLYGKELLARKVAEEHGIKPDFFVKLIVKSEYH